MGQDLEVPGALSVVDHWAPPAVLLTIVRAGARGIVLLVKTQRGTITSLHGVSHHTPYSRSCVFFSLTYYLPLRRRFLPRQSPTDCVASYLPTGGVPCAIRWAPCLSPVSLFTRGVLPTVLVISLNMRAICSS